MIGLERFSLYKYEDELTADLEQTNLVNWARMESSQTSL